jgi:uncharacterized protein YcbK (DUF882 family)
MPTKKNNSIIYIIAAILGGYVLVKKVLPKLLLTMEKPKYPDYLTPNFKWVEFESRDGAKMPDAVKQQIIKVAQQLEVLRAAIGKPININSGYRSPAHNAAVGGVTNSFHKLGMAADIRVNGMTPKQVHSKIEELIAAGKMTQGGLGLYPTFVHYDIQGKKRRWYES